MFVENRNINFLSKHQANALLAISQKNVRMKVLLLLMLDAGLRVSEVINIRLSDFDFKKRLLTVRSLKKREKTAYRQSLLFVEL